MHVVSSPILRPFTVFLGGRKNTFLDPDDGISCRHLVSALLYWTSCVQENTFLASLVPDEGISCRHLVCTLFYWNSCVQEKNTFLVSLVLMTVFPIVISSFHPLILNFLCAERTPSWWAWSWWRHFLSPSRLCNLLYWTSCAQKEHLPDELGPDGGISSVAISSKTSFTKLLVCRKNTFLGWLWAWSW